MERNLKEESGITLIALIITIIVMLILVAVTITIAVNGGLFNYAREAGAKTNEAKDLEQNYVDLAEDLSYEDLIGIYSAELNPDDGTTPETGDEYETQDYIYKYNYVYSDEGWWGSGDYYDQSTDGWGVAVKENKKDKDSYEPILYSINGKPVNTLEWTFWECSNMVTAPTIPNTVVFMGFTFQECTSLKIAPIIPNSVKIMQATFSGCTLLTKATIIPNSVTYMPGIFFGCELLNGTINYAGTMAQWDAISEKGDWNTDTNISNVKCTDGDITL